jgi:hypothetical protein
MEMEVAMPQIEPNQVRANGDHSTEIDESVTVTLQHLSPVDLIGSWSLVQIAHTFENGNVQKSFGEGDGVLIFEENGRFCQCLLRHDLPQVASGNRGTVTPEESNSIVQGSLTFFGKWSLNATALTFHIERSSFPNWNGMDQTRVVTSLTHTRMTITAPASTLGARGDQTWTRVA